MKSHLHRYIIPRDRHAFLEASDALLTKQRAVSMTNSFGFHFANTITASEYKGAQKQKDKSGGYILVRYTP